MQNLNKKGLSDIISTVLIILLSISLVFILSNSIVNLLNNPSLSPDTSCPILQFKSIVKMQKVCYDKNLGDILVTVQRSNDENLLVNSMEFIIEKDSGETNSFSCGNQCGTCKLPNVGKTTTYYLEASGNEKSISLSGGVVLSIFTFGKFLYNVSQFL